MEEKKATTWSDIVEWIRNYEARHRHEPEPEPDDEPSESDQIWREGRRPEED